MRAVIQRVTRASVTVEGATVSSIGRGLLVLLGVSRDDSPADADYLLDKVLGLRVFPDSDRKMNLDVFQAGGSLLVISQFTLYGDCRKGRRPSFDQAAAPETARALYQYFVTRARERKIRVETGEFQAYMAVELTNDGPVTILFDSTRLF
ncbi:MAG: D-tyrosyl-tRNA(Tyr) deacylase [Bryobacteraceae bacterium]|nr:D-tyrosyl-tRNA(Tyr) deacylase [Bryobacteraceae bacterium]